MATNSAEKIAKSKERVERAKQGDASAAFHEARSHVDKKNYSAVFGLMENVPDDKKTYDCWLIMADAANHQGKHGDAVKFLGRIPEDRRSYTAWQEMAFARAGTRAYAAVLKAVGKIPDGRRDDKVRLVYAKASLALGEYELAKGAIGQVAEHKRSADDMANLAAASNGLGQFSTAEALCNKIPDTHSRHTEIKVTALRGQRRFAEAADLLLAKLKAELAKDKNFQNATLCAMLGTLCDIEKYKEMDGFLGILQQRNNPMVSYFVARRFYEMGDKEKAVGVLHNAIATDDADVAHAALHMHLTGTQAAAAFLQGGEFAKRISGMARRWDTARVVTEEYGEVGTLHDGLRSLRAAASRANYVNSPDIKRNGADNKAVMGLSTEVSATRPKP